MSYVEDVEELAMKLRLCYQCGTCSAGCPVFRVDSDRNPRLLVEKLLLGDMKGVLEEDSNIWYCSLCLTCSQRCPQGVDLAHILVELKNLAVKHGVAPSGLLAEATALMETGITAQISKAVEKRRDKWGLPKWQEPPNDEIKKLLDVTGFTEAVEKISKKAKETGAA
ncbi:MAG: 4Fe-4S dicluster domain-containing protein [Candidatus Heimdallarchaeota archaeon]